MAVQAKTQATFEEYRSLPETNQIVELIDGEIVVNPPRDKHQKTLWQIVTTLTPLMAKGEAPFAPTGLHFNDSNSYEPDLFWVSPENTQCVLEENGRYWQGAPDLIVEILSPSTASDDRGIKFEMYQHYGVREYWLVDPEAKFVEVYGRDGDRFERQGVFKADQSFVSAVLNDATINIQSWFSQ